MNRKSPTQQRQRVRITEVRTTFIDMTAAELEKAGSAKEGRWSLSRDETTGALVLHRLELVNDEFPGGVLPWELREPV